MPMLSEDKVATPAQGWVHTVLLLVTSQITKECNA